MHTHANITSNGTAGTTGSSTKSTESTGSALAKGSLDPYAPIEKRRLLAYDGMRSAGHTVRMEDASSPSGWRECGVVSESYLLVENADVRDLAYEVADRSGLGFEVERREGGGRVVMRTHVNDDSRTTVRVSRVWMNVSWCFPLRGGGGPHGFEDR